MQVALKYLKSTRLTWSRVYGAQGDPQSMLPARDLVLAAIRSRLDEGLHKRIADKNRIVRDWSVFVSWIWHGYWQVTFKATLEEGVTPDQVKTAFDAYLSQLVEAGMSEVNFERLKKRTLALLQRRWERPNKAAFSFLNGIAYHGYDFAWNWLDIVREMTREDTERFLSVFKAEPVRNGTLIRIPGGRINQ